MLSQTEIQAALKEVKYPGFSRDILSFGLIKSIEVVGADVAISIAVTTADPDIPGKLKADVEAAVGKVPGLGKLEVHMHTAAPKGMPGQVASKSTGGAAGVNGAVKHIIAIASGKGGVGKSTFAVNFACALAKKAEELGMKQAIGLLDCDIYGPSVPLMMGIQERPNIEGHDLLPIEHFGLKMMSMGFLVDEDTPVVWRGPMVTKTIQQFLQNVRWGDLEILVVDLPPGTGDAQLSLVQTIPLRGAIVVTTPQVAAVNVASRGAMMFGKVNVPLMGVVENMSYLEESSGHKNYLFGQGGGQVAADRLQTKLLGQIPIDAKLREGADHGIPIILSHPQAASAQVIRAIANEVWDSLVSTAQAVS